TRSFGVWTNWMGYGVTKDWGTPRGLQSVPLVSVVLPRIWLPSRTIRYFSAPGLRAGGMALRSPANPYTPEKSGLPSGRRPFFVDDAAVDALGAAPVTVTVTDFVSVVLSEPATFRIYVVVAVGVT